jgi:hypothetical protein
VVQTSGGIVVHDYLCRVVLLQCSR